MIDSDRQNCPKCGLDLVSGARFCAHCGHALDVKRTEDHPKPTAEPALSSNNSPERRQTTVLFCNLVDSTALSTRMDPEEFVVVLQTFLAAGSAVVREHNGFIARYMGDGFLVYFGYPRAEEHSAESAVRAALELVRCVRELRALPDVVLQARVGIATGVVVIGDLIGSGSSREAPAWGVTPNLAARLQALASPGTVLMSDETHDLVGTLFDCNAWGTRQLQGFPAPVPVWEAVRARSLESRFNALRATAVGAELVGRKRELARLLSFWQRVERGHGKCVCVRADAGIGKSKLVARFLKEIGRKAHTILRLQCVPNLQGTAFLPVIDLLQRIAAEMAEADAAPEVALRELLAQGYGQSEKE